MPTTHAQLMTSGSRCQLSIAGETIVHVSTGGETQSLLALVRNVSVVERDFSGEIVEVTVGIITLIEADLDLPVTRQSKFRWDSPVGEIVFNLDDINNLQRQAVYLDIPVWSPVSVRKGPEAFKRELM